MGLVDSFKSFMHSITTEDHYASYDSPYKNSAINNVGNTVGGGNSSSSSRLHELNRLATANSSSHSLIEGSTNANGSRTSLSRNGSSTTVGYRPGLRSSNTNSSDLQLQNLNASGQPPLPSVDSLWDRLESWLEEEYPELGDNLNDGVTTADLNEFENDLGCGSLPVEIRQFYKRHDGQFRGGKPTGLIMGLTLLDLEGIVEEYAIWAKVNQRLEKQQHIFQHQQQQQQQQQRKQNTTSSTEASEFQSNQNRINNSFIANQKSIPPNAIQPYYVHRGWIPLAKDFCGNQIAVDLAPGPQGHWSQIIIFGRDFDTKLVIASNLQEFIFGFVSDLELGNFQIDQNDQDGGFLDSSRNDDDYMVGDGEEDQGELCFVDRGRKEFGNSVKGKLTYLEVLKRRALKKFGITNIERFSTSFTPQRLSQSKPNESGASSPARTSSPSLSGTAANTNKSNNPLINMESTSKVALPKETLIDEEKKVSEEPAKESKSETIAEKVIDSKPESKVSESQLEEKEIEREIETEKEQKTAAADKTEVVDSSANDEENEEKDTTEAEEQDKDSRPLTKSQKKNQNKKAKKQQQKQKQNENENEDEDKITEDLNDVAL